jgi:putative YphP/YqiW family bacilliredoxin
MYPQEMVNPMQAELTAAGFQDLQCRSSWKRNEIRRYHASCKMVCGCAARNAREPKWV